MSRILKVSDGDYRLQVKGGGNIILDTGNAAGTVTITGNLDVQGQTTTIESVNATVKDNIIQLNQGDPGSQTFGGGISLGVSGIEIERGSLDSAQWLFSEQITHYDATTESNVQGTWVAQTRNIINNSTALSSVCVRSITTDGNADLVFDLQNQPVVLRIGNITEQGQVGSTYAARLTNGNDIPNLLFVQNYVASSWQAGNPGVQGIAAVDNIHFPLNGPTLTQIQATATTLDMKVAGVTRAQVSASGIYIGNITISQDTITDISGNANLILTSNNNNVEVKGILNLDDQSGAVAPVAGATRVYSRSNNGVGSSGLFFNSNGAALSEDEIMSRRKAVVLSILL